MRNLQSKARFKNQPVLILCGSADGSDLKPVNVGPEFDLEIAKIGANIRDKDNEISTCDARIQYLVGSLEGAHGSHKKNISKELDYLRTEKRQLRQEKDHLARKEILWLQWRESAKKSAGA